MAVTTIGHVRSYVFFKRTNTLTSFGNDIIAFTYFKHSKKFKFVV